MADFKIEKNPDRPGTVNVYRIVEGKKVFEGVRSGISLESLERDGLVISNGDTISVGGGEYDFDIGAIGPEGPIDRGC